MSLLDALRLWIADKSNQETAILAFGLFGLAMVLRFGWAA